LQDNNFDGLVVHREEEAADIIQVIKACQLLRKATANDRDIDPSFSIVFKIIGIPVIKNTEFGKISRSIASFSARDCG
jgi:hypothetical protein